MTLFITALTGDEGDGPSLMCDRFGGVGVQTAELSPADTGTKLPLYIGPLKPLNRGNPLRPAPGLSVAQFAAQQPAPNYHTPTDTEQTEPAHTPRYLQLTRL